MRKSDRGERERIKRIDEYRDRDIDKTYATEQQYIDESCKTGISNALHALNLTTCTHHS